MYNIPEIEEKKNNDRNEIKGDTHSHTHTNTSVTIGGERTLDATNRLLNRVEHKRGKENRQDLKDRCVEYFYLI